MFCLLCVVFLVVALLSYYGLYKCRRTPSSMNGLHVMKAIPGFYQQTQKITGGSSGIGKCFAIEVAKLGAHVSLLARKQANLLAARNEVTAACMDCRKQKIAVIAVDVSGEYKEIESAVHRAEEELGPVDILLNCAGFAVAAKLEDTSIADIKKLMDVNYMGSYLMTRAVLPGMKSRRKGSIVFVCSMAGLLGIYGYTAYAASKFAVRGLAETLQMEVKAHNIHVTVAFPPDTDTPGFAEEIKTKPIETQIISETSGLFSPESVAKVLLKDVLDNKFVSTIGRDGCILSILCAGMMPVTSIVELTVQVFAMGPLRLFGAIFHLYFDRVVANCHKTNEQKM